MPDERSAAQLSPEATYRAIGRYVYEFSQLVAHMRDAMTRHLDRSNGGVAAIAFAEAQPRQIANAFFTMCRTVTHLDPDEEKTGARVGARVGEAIEMRENVAAGDWWVGASSLGAVAVKRSATDLDHRSESLAELTNLVAEYGALCLRLPPYDRGEHRVGDYLVMRASEAVREGPKALSAMHVFYTPALPGEVGRHQSRSPNCASRSSRRRSRWRWRRLHRNRRRLPHRNQRLNPQASPHRHRRSRHRARFACECDPTSRRSGACRAPGIATGTTRRCGHRARTHGDPLG